MRNLLWRLVPLLLPACMVDTPVVEGQDDRLGEGLRKWCEGGCTKMIQCGEDDTLARCVPDCMDLFEEDFIGKGAICEASAKRIMDCIDESTCADLSVQPACNVESEMTHCVNGRDPVKCGVSSGGESIGGSAGSAGSLTPRDCDIELADCSDGKTYGVVCTGLDTDPVCECHVDDFTAGAYAPTVLECPDEDQAKQICGWPVAGTGAEALPPPVICDAVVPTNPGGAATDGCFVDLDACNDGHYYGVTCDGPPGAVTCNCSVDGELVRQDTSPTGVCPFIFGPGSAAIVVNYVCGFRISQPGFP